MSRTLLSAIVSKPLSATDIREKLGGKVTIVKYSQLSRFKSLQQLMSGGARVVILFETKQDYGHWICLVGDPGYATRINFMDSYGINVDDEREWVSSSGLRKLGQGQPYLSRLLIRWMNDGGSVDYSDRQLQRYSSHISTCGHWCILRLFRSDLNNNQFVNWCKTESCRLGLTFDEFAALFVHCMK
jgi:hypothetical protein